MPGQDPIIYPEHSGILLQPGDALVLQIHYHYDTTPTPDRSTVALQTRARHRRRSSRSTSSTRSARSRSRACPGANAPLCDRNAALADDARLYGPAGSFIEPGLLLLCGKTPDELAATFHDGVASSTLRHDRCPSRARSSARSATCTRSARASGSRSIRTPRKPKVLLDIPTWNFDWQMNYELADSRSTSTRARRSGWTCSWDRSLDPNRPPKYIVFAEGTEDEMCFSTYAIIPDH